MHVIWGGGFICLYADELLGRRTRRRTGTRTHAPTHRTHTSGTGPLEPDDQGVSQQVKYGAWRAGAGDCFGSGSDEDCRTKLSKSVLYSEAAS